MINSVGLIGFISFGYLLVWCLMLSCLVSIVCAYCLDCWCLLVLCFCSWLRMAVGFEVVGSIVVACLSYLWLRFSVCLTCWFAIVVLIVVLASVGFVRLWLCCW